MKIRRLAFAAAALTAAAALAAAPAREPRSAAPEVERHETLAAEIARGAREILAAVVPEIRLPQIEVKLPPVGGPAG
jgi:hypothetical protein